MKENRENSRFPEVVLLRYQIFTGNFITSRHA